MRLVMGTPGRWVSLGLGLAVVMWLAGCTMASTPVPPTPVPPTRSPPTSVAVVLPTATTAAAPAATLTTAPAGMGVQILDPADGAQVREGAPLAVRFVAQGGPFIEVALLVDGRLGSVIAVSSPETTYEGTLQWEPAGAGSHSLAVQAMDPTKQIATAEIRVLVAGGATPTPAPGGLLAVDEDHRQRIIQAYQDAFGLELTAPAVARKERPGVPSDPWVSVAWVGDVMYQVNLYPDGTIQTFATSLKLGARPPGTAPYDQTPACRPAGTRTMLVVLLDYGNLGVPRDEVLADLQEASAEVNAAYARYATAAGLAQPIFQIDPTAVCLSPAPDLSKSGYALTPDLIQSLTGLDPAGFDFTAQVDLDANNTARNALRNVGLDTYGWAAPGLGLVPKTVNIWVAVDDKSQLTGGEGRLTRTLLSHEWLHLMGYPGTHDWPCTDGTTEDQADQCDVGNMPALMLGWVDTDGDGLVEIVDPEPYGMAGR
jgi:hypothetical protein